MTFFHKITVSVKVKKILLEHHETCCTAWTLCGGKKKPYNLDGIKLFWINCAASIRQDHGRIAQDQRRNEKVGIGGPSRAAGNLLPCAAVDKLHGSKQCLSLPAV